MYADAKASGHPGSHAMNHRVALSIYFVVFPQLRIDERSDTDLDAARCPRIWQPAVQVVLTAIAFRKRSSMALT